LSALELPAGKTALLVMDVQNDIVHIDGKLGGELGAGAMPKLIAEKEMLHNIAGLMTAARCGCSGYSRSARLSRGLS
jgi:nicotinamidase-related amidase